jgi:hypothetical protein
MKKYKLDGDINREYTPEEYAQDAIDTAIYQTELADKAKVDEEVAAAKATAQAKLAALGLTADDLKALGL